MTDWTEVNDQLTTPAFFATGGHHALFKRLRAEDPIHWTDGAGAARPFWSVTLHADCVRILEDAETFSSEHGGIMLPTADYPTPEQRHAMGYGALPTHIDPPLHLKIRQPFNKHWSVPAIARMKGKIQACVDAIMADVLPRGECDLVEDVAAQLPARLVCEMMGVPEADRADIRYYCAAFMGAQDPQYQIDGSEQKTQMVMMQAVFDYMYKLATERRFDPRDDFTSVAGSLRVDEQLLDDRMLGWWCFSFVAAGLETTRNALSVGLYELMQHPDQAERLRADPALLPLAAEEIVRWSSPSKYKWRIPVRDVEMGGRLLRKGEWVICWLASANRDEAVFANPDDFDVGRTPNPHLAYSIGEHSCLGRHLARLEIQMMVSAVLANMPDMEIAGDAEWLVSNNHSGFKTLPVRFTPPLEMAG